MTEQKLERSSNFELLRIVAMFMIVAVHYAGHGVRHVLLPPAQSAAWLMGSLANRIFTSCLIPAGKIGVGLFFMLTGFFMIDKECRPQRLLKPVLQVYFYAVLSLVIWGGVQLFSIYSFPNMSAGAGLGLLVTACFPISLNSWWFISSYVVLYLLIPHLNRLVHWLEGKRSVLLFALFLLAWYTTSVFESTYMGLQRAVFFYLVGAWVKRKGVSCGKCLAIFVFLVSWGAFVCCDMLITGCIGHALPGKLFTKLLESIEVGLCVPAAVLSLFLFFKDLSMRPSPFVNAVASTTFGVYLFHESGVCRQLIWDGILHVLDKQYCSALFPLLALVSVILVFACASAIDYVRLRFFEKKILPVLEKKVRA